MEEQLEKWWAALSAADREYLANTDDDAPMDERTADLLMRGPIGPLTVGWVAQPDSFISTTPTTVREFIERKSSQA